MKSFLEAAGYWVGGRRRKENQSVRTWSKKRREREDARTFSSGLFCQHSPCSVMNMIGQAREEQLRLNLFASIDLQITSQSLVSSEKFNKATKILPKGL